MWRYTGFWILCVWTDVYICLSLFRFVWRLCPPDTWAHTCVHTRTSEFMYVYTNIYICVHMCTINIYIFFCLLCAGRTVLGRAYGMLLHYSADKSEKYIFSWHGFGHCGLIYTTFPKLRLHCSDHWYGKDNNQLFAKSMQKVCKQCCIFVAHSLRTFCRIFAYCLHMFCIFVAYFLEAWLLVCCVLLVYFWHTFEICV